ncbi:MAG: ABC transporter permease subunit [Erysipelotrichaceae bacterium]|nr:ABC transporter permease subunit [Erysipelotrichaceae bacterium]
MKKVVKKEYIITCLLIIIAWHFLAINVDNDVLIPYPQATFLRIGQILQDKSFYLALKATLAHVINGCLFSLLLALSLGILGYRFKMIRHLFEPLNVIIKTIPNISYIIIILIWFGANQSVSIICFLIIFPMLYSNILYALDSMNRQYQDVELIYHESFDKNVIYHLLPYLYPIVLSSLKTCLALGFKVGIMAEILGQARLGIGRLLQLAKLDLDMTAIFAYTIIIIFICMLIDVIFNKLIHFYQKKEVSKNGET